ncbi:DUF2534 family protein [Citrobacter sp. JGM124]|uniref:DUF2534 family protein n=1 Tax=Citrobacter sp. JGM124 TaxID=2799789 RepID=UPI001BA5938F|nr:DUF2534 family protein [Citrobacter sp. JGM124]MBS0848163.1 DUF2534 family protein [Citrobacter sp. JGM124]
MRHKLRTPEGKKFLIFVSVAFLIVLSIISTITFEGVVDQYNLPMSQWETSLFFIQGAWTFLYSIVFTILVSIPVGILMLGPKESNA